jgi:hypothetical protein
MKRRQTPQQKKKKLTDGGISHQPNTGVQVLVAFLFFFKKKQQLIIHHDKCNPNQMIRLFSIIQSYDAASDME